MEDQRGVLSLGYKILIPKQFLNSIGKVVLQSGSIN